MASGFVWYPAANGYTPRQLFHCQCCSKLTDGFPKQKYCVPCGRNYLKPKMDAIDLAIAEMCREQAGLLKRKYLRGQLSERA
jgi:hypothetical protein